MLSSFTIRNFKSYEKATLQLGPLTVLVGANASGKSNAVEALRFLSWVAQGNKLGSIRYALQDDAQAIRGTVNDLGHGGRRRFSLSCVTTDPTWNRYSVTLERQTDEDLHIIDERLSGALGLVPLFEVVSSQESGGDIRVAYNNFARGGTKPQVTCTDQMAVLLQLQSSARFGPRQKKAQKVIPEVTRRYQGWLSNIVFLDPRPSTMRGYSFKTERTLSGHGANLSGVLFNLCQEEHTAAEVLHFIKALPEQDITKVDFIGTPRNEAMVKLTETFGGRQTEYDAALLSDGTLRVLGIAAATLSAPKGSIVVIEEIDNGVHPSRAEQMLNRLSRVAHARSLRVLISSHNPALLDALPNDAVPDVVFCYRDPKTGASCLQRLADLPAYPELIAQGAVGHLLTQGILDRVVKLRRGPAERRRRARAWLEAIKTQAG